MKSLQIGPDLYTLSNLITQLEIEMTCYSKVLNLESVTRRTMPSLRHSKAKFSHTNFKNKHIVITGGNDSNKFISDQAFAFSLDTETWHPMPPMRKGRFLHSSAALGDKIYVVCGSASV
mmetsp:Transcript_9272/g.11309  ORF Transcript_9272/g.11309 Transcript_9272/m.11309 type:complete len:119 (+) Transcript_9272:266-622(+)